MEPTKSGNITNLDPHLRERLEGIVALLCAEVEALMNEEECKDSTTALRAISDAVFILERYLYPEFDGIPNDEWNKLVKRLNRELI